MPQIHLHIVTSNQSRKDKAHRLARLIASAINIPSDPEIEKYDKILDAYSIEFRFPIPKDQDPRIACLDAAAALCMPWQINYHGNQATMYLIYNRTDHSTITQTDFNVIYWGHIQILE